MLTRPATIMRSAWRGLPRNTSAPKRETSKRGPAIAIISIAQHASPKPSGQMAFARAQFTTLSTVVNTIPFSNSSRMRSASLIGPSGMTRSDAGGAGPAAPARVRNGFSGRSLMTGCLAVLRSFPLQRPLLQEVQVAGEQDDDEQHHLDEAIEPQPVESDRPRVEEHRLDVEQDEQHGHHVELDAEAAPRIAHRVHAALVGRDLLRRDATRNDE